MNKIESELEAMSSPVRPYLVSREDRVGCPLCNNRPEECQRHNMGVHNAYAPPSVMLKFAAWFLAAIGALVLLAYL